MKKIILMLALLQGLICYGKPKGETDSLALWSSKFYQLHVQKFSAHGNWIVVGKFYKDNRDTAMVLSTRKREKTMGTLNKMYQFSFIDSDRLLASGNNCAVLWNLKKNLKMEYTGIRSSGKLSKERYFLIDERNNLRVYNSRDQCVATLSDIVTYKVNAEGTIFYLYRKKGELSEIIHVTFNNQLEVLYKTRRNIKSVQLSPSEKQFFVIENTESELQHIVAISTANRKVQHLKGYDVSSKAFIKLTEIRNGEGYMVSSILNSMPTDTAVSIWYGNDGALEAKEDGTVQYRNWIWDPALNTLKGIPVNRFPMVFSLDNPRYYIAFNPGELQNYVTQFPKINAYLYDIEKDTYQNLGVMEPEISVSGRGKYMTYKDVSGNWVLLEISTLKRVIVGGEKLEKPAFSFDNKFIYFDSDEDAWRYDIQRKQLLALGIAPGKEVRLLGRDRRMLCEETGYDLSCYRIDLDKPSLVSVYNDEGNRKTILEWKNNHLQRIVEAGSLGLKLFDDAQKSGKFCYLMEDFNMPTQLVYRDLKERDSVVVFKSNAHDKAVSLLKNEIINYKNPEGNLLKGVLYYPAQFDAKKKYPMVVHIYQRQHRTSNQYMTPLAIFPLAFNIRVLLEKGYFVYMPDIVSDSSGVGWAALHCVESAMDALAVRKDIQIGKVGLIGHSFGGYQTNFIATHSNRFTTYISGAGASDIIRMYFSYNYTSSNPFYWQFESGQYNMKYSFAENKQLYFRNNPIHDVEKVNAPILLWAGKNDKRIVWDQVMEFYIGLKRNRKDVVALFYPNQAHAFQNGSKEEKDLSERVMQWWDYFLKDKKDVGWIDQQMKKNAG
jgi:dipeptidyl aminopeptidase/acylaminoacyl peptidase